MSVSKEDYLQEIYRLQYSNNRAVKVTEIANALKVSKPSVSEMVRKLAKEDKVKFKRFSGISLPEKGIVEARKTVRKHQLLEVFFNKVLNIKNTFHKEAHSAEHSLSDNAADRLDSILKKPNVCPDGNPIPSKNSRVVKLTQLPAKIEARVIFAATQKKECLERLNSLGIVPQAKIKIVRRLGNGPLILSVKGSEVILGQDICKEIFVERK